jgi:hypothetical protein
MQDSLFLDVLLSNAAAARWLQETRRALRWTKGLNHSSLRKWVDRVSVQIVSWTV